MLCNWVGPQNYTFTLTPRAALPSGSLQAPIFPRILRGFLHWEPQEHRILRGFVHRALPNPRILRGFLLSGPKSIVFYEVLCIGLPKNLAFYEVLCVGRSTKQLSGPRKVHQGPPSNLVDLERSTSDPKILPNLHFPILQTLIFIDSASFKSTKLVLSKPRGRRQRR